MDVVTIERDFTAWVAGKLNLKLDKGIFRGGIPQGVGTGVGVLFGSEVSATGFYGFRPRTLHVVRLVAHQCDGDAETAGFLQAEGHHGTGVRVHEQAHASSFFTGSTPR